LQTEGSHPCWTFDFTGREFQLLPVFSWVYDAVVADVTVAIFTFTKNEATAVTELLNRVHVGLPAFGPTVWALTTAGQEVVEGRLSDGRVARLEHRPLSAQGNVIAAAALSRSAWGHRADYYVFYGCCGAVDKNAVDEVFRVAWVSYMSLGVVSDSPSGEVVKLKNKWIVRTKRSEQEPLDPIELPAWSGTAGSASVLGLRDAHVLATDKVINVSPGIAPVPIHKPPSGAIYAKEEWTYAQALAQYVEMAPETPILIDMETFGIASTMEAMGLGLRVVVLRVVTDALTDKRHQTDADQLRRLRAGSNQLAGAIATMLGM
jgi:hypothetical protein